VEILGVFFVVRSFAIPVCRTVAINDMTRRTSDSNAISTNNNGVKIVISGSSKRLSDSDSDSALLAYDGSSLRSCPQR
jgi:hypothetical protein